MGGSEAKSCARKSIPNHEEASLVYAEYGERVGVDRTRMAVMFDETWQNGHKIPFGERKMVIFHALLSL